MRQIQHSRSSMRGPATPPASSPLQSFRRSLRIDKRKDLPPSSSRSVSEDLFVLAKENVASKPWYSSWSLHFSGGVGTDERQYRRTHHPNSLLWLVVPVVVWSSVHIAIDRDDAVVYGGLCLAIGACAHIAMLTSPEDPYDL